MAAPPAVSVHGPFKILGDSKSVAYGGKLIVNSGAGSYQSINHTNLSTVWCRTTSHVLICAASEVIISNFPAAAWVPTNGTLRFKVYRPNTGQTSVYSWFVFAGGTTAGPA